MWPSARTRHGAYVCGVSLTNARQIPTKEHFTTLYREQAPGPALVRVGHAGVRLASRSIPPPWRRSVRFRLALHTYDAPPCGPSVRVVPDRQTKSWKIRARNVLPLVPATRYALGSNHTKCEPTVGHAERAVILYAWGSISFLTPLGSPHAPRAPHGHESHVRRATRNRAARHSRMIVPLFSRPPCGFDTHYPASKKSGNIPRVGVLL